MSLITDYEETEDPKETNATVDSQLDIDSGDDDSMENFSEEKIDEAISMACSPETRMIPMAPPIAVAGAQIVSFIMRCFLMR